MYTQAAWFIPLVAVPCFVCGVIKSTNQSVEIAARIGCNFVGLIVAQLVCLFVLQDLEATLVARSLELDPNREYSTLQEQTEEQQALLRQVTNDASNVFAPAFIVAISLLHSLAFSLVIICNQLLRGKSEH